MPGARHELSNILQVAGQIWRYGRIADARLKELEDENRRLKKMYAEERLMSELRKEALEKKW